MIYRLFTTTALALLLFLSVNAQTYELHQVKQIPSIDESNMKIIAFSIQNLFEQYVKNPEKYPSSKSAYEAVYAFYDTDDDRVLNKINPLLGKIYKPIDSADLKMNNRLLFNLTFDENGNLIVPEKIIVISYRKETQNDRTILRVNPFSFEIKVSDDIKSDLLKVKLQNLAKADVNSLTGGLNPVPVKIPIDMSYSLSYKSNKICKASINNGYIDISIGRNFNNSEEKDKYIGLIKEQTDILLYKKGIFDFVIEETNFNYHIDFNIMRDIVWSSQPKDFTVRKQKINSFTGEGKKIKNEK